RHREVDPPARRAPAREVEARRTAAPPADPVAMEHARTVASVLEANRHPGIGDLACAPTEADADGRGAKRPGIAGGGRWRRRGGGGGRRIVAAGNSGARQCRGEEAWEGHAHALERGTGDLYSRCRLNAIGKPTAEELVPAASTTTRGWRRLARERWPR